jgi:hypothetical protein
MVGAPDDPRLTAAELAKALVSPTTSAFRVIMQAHKGVDFGNRQPAWEYGADELRAATAKLRDNDFSHIEDMLMQQAEALQAVFTLLAERALGATEIPTSDLFFRYGLRAQSQCRATLETLATIKNPPAVLFARQANVAAGPQQINNATDPRARENPAAPNELSGAGHELCQDGGTPRIAVGDDPPLAPVGTIDRAANVGRQGALEPQRLEGGTKGRST